MGAKLPGRAATDEASAWFGNVLEAGIYKNPDNGDEHRALVLRRRGVEAGGCRQQRGHDDGGLLHVGGRKARFLRGRVWRV